MQEKQPLFQCKISVRHSLSDAEKGARKRIHVFPLSPSPAWIWLCFMASARGRRAAMSTLAWSSISVAILMAFLCPLIQASRPSFHGERLMIEDKASLVSKGLETLQFQRHHQSRGSSSGSVLDSARQVPTGPDPLHHNSFPSVP